MAYVELSDADAALLEAARKMGGATGLDLAARAAKLHEQLISNKDTSVSYQGAIKKLYPDAKLPADVAAPYVERLDAVETRFNTWLADREKEREEADKARAQADFDTLWSKTVKDYSLTAEGEEKLVKFMQVRRLHDPEAAAALYYKQNPEPAAPSVPSSIGPDRWGIGPLPGEDEKTSKLLLSDPTAWADNEAAAVLTEVRRQAA